MSILIRGLDMPKDGEQLCIDINSGGRVCINLDLTCETIASAVSVSEIEDASLDRIVPITKTDHTDVNCTKDSIEVKPDGEVFIQRQDLQTGEVKELKLITARGKLYAVPVEKRRVFQPGDKVRILDGSQIKDYCGGWTSVMNNYVGDVSYVKDVHREIFDNPEGYKVNLVDSIFAWDARGLELVEESMED